MFWFSCDRRDTCFWHSVASVACVGLIKEIAIYCRSGAWSGATRKSGGEWSGAVSGRCRKTMEWSGARSGRSRSGNGAGSGGYRIRLERGAVFSPAPLRSHALQLILCAYGQQKESTTTTTPISRHNCQIHPTHQKHNINDSEKSPRLLCPRHGSGEDRLPSLNRF